MKERRRYKRIGKRFLSWFRTIRIILTKRCASRWDIVSTRNLSAGGVLFNYNKDIKVGTGLHFRIISPFSPHMIRCIGKVVRTEKPEKNVSPRLFLVAAEFDKITSKDKGLIDSFANEF